MMIACNASKIGTIAFLSKIRESLRAVAFIHPGINGWRKANANEHCESLVNHV